MTLLLAKMECALEDEILFDTDEYLPDTDPGDPPESHDSTGADASALGHCCGPASLGSRRTEDDKNHFGAGALHESPQ